MPKAPPLTLPNKPIDATTAAAFLSTARHEPAPPPAAEPPPPSRGHVQLASGQRRRMVLMLSPEVGAAIDELAAETGASRTWHVDRLLRGALNL